jgi:PAS domain S-box-containing protein
LLTTETVICAVGDETVFASIKEHLDKSDFTLVRAPDTESFQNLLVTIELTVCCIIDSSIYFELSSSEFIKPVPIFILSDDVIVENDFSPYIAGIVNPLDLSKNFSFLVNNAIALCKKYDASVKKLNQYQAIIDNNSDGTVLVHANGRMRFVSSSALDKFGYTEDEFLRVDPSLFTHPNDLHALLDTVQSIASGSAKLPQKLRYRFRKKDGSYLWVESLFSPLISIENEDCFVISYRDISDIKKTEEDFRMIFDNAPLGIYVAKTDGTIIDANSKLLEILGSPSVEATKKINVLNFPPLIETGYSQKFVECIEKQSVITMELLYTSKWNKSAYLSNFLVPITNADGNVEKVFTLMENITERKNAEDQLKVMYKEKELLLRELQHRAKNSFTIIMSLMDLKLEMIHVEDTKEAIKELRSRVLALTELYALINEMEKPDRVMLDRYCDRIISSFSALAGNITFEKKFDSISINTKDAATIGLIVTELITNALKHAFPDKQQGKIIVSLKLHEGFMKLEIKDNGVGIGNNWKSESSLGMNLTHAMVEQLHGKIEFYTKRGTTVSIVFPEFILISS